VDQFLDLASLLLTAIRKEIVFPLPSRGTLQDVKTLMGSKDVAIVVNALLTPERLDLPGFLQERMPDPLHLSGHQPTGDKGRLEFKRRCFGSSMLFLNN